jgi:hypothetical protein
MANCKRLSEHDPHDDCNGNLPEYRVTVEYIVPATDDEDAVKRLRDQLYRDDNLAHAHNETRLDYIVREVH